MDDSAGPTSSTGGRHPLEETMDLFDLLLEASDPIALLAAEPDDEVRSRAENLWRHHLLAAGQNFLEQPIDFRIQPVYEPGQVLLKRFEVERSLGQGGMGEVYLAYDRTLGERVALKTIVRLLASSDWIRLRFIAEVKNARRVTHPNVCRIHEIFDEGEIPFFAMEYVDGVSLGRLLELGGIARKTAYELVLQLAEGLQTAHRNGVVHGDFKPSNVLVTTGEPRRAVIMDFGLARAFGAAILPDPANEPAGAGTLDYMAPELIAGEAATTLSDVFAFGKVGSQLLPGEAIWDQCIAPDPKTRLQSLEEVLAHLRRQSTRRYWIGGAALAAAGYLTYRISSTRQPTVRIESSARLLVNGFRIAGAEPTVARAARGLFVTGLYQSPRVRLVSDRDIFSSLRGLAPEGKLPVGGEVLRKLVSILRASYWIDAQLTKISGRYTLSLNLLRSSDGQTIGENQFRDSSAIAPLTKDAVGWVRQVAGESAQSLSGNPSDAEAFTSHVPEALESYYGAMEHYAVGETEPAIPLLEEATRLDPNFAQALNILGMCQNSLRRHAEAFENLDRAHRLATSLPVRERTWIDANYYALVEDPVQMVKAAQDNSDFHPDEPRFYRILARLLCWTGRPDKSLAPSRRAAELSPASDLNQSELIFNLSEAGHFSEALDQYRKVKAAGGQNPYLEYSAGLALVGLERYQDAMPFLSAVAEDPDLYTHTAKLLDGRVDSSLAGLQQELASAQTDNNPARLHKVCDFLCGSYFLTDREATAALYVAQMAQLSEIPAHARLLQCTASWAVRLQNDSILDDVRTRLRNIATRWPNNFTKATVLHAEALVAWRRLDFSSALSLLNQSFGTAYTVWPLWDLAECYTAAEEWDLAEEAWQNFEGRRGTILKLWSPAPILSGWLRRAEVANRRGDSALAQRCASKILDHWLHRNSRTLLVEKAQTANRK